MPEALGVTAQGVVTRIAIRIFDTIRGRISRVTKDGSRCRCDTKNQNAECKLDDRQIEKLVKMLGKGARSASHETNLWILLRINAHLECIHNITTQAIIRDGPCVACMHSHAAPDCRGARA